MTISYFLSFLVQYEMNSWKGCQVCPRMGQMHLNCERYRC